MAHDQALKISFVSQKLRLQQKLMGRLEASAASTFNLLITFRYSMP